MTVNEEGKPLLVTDSVGTRTTTEYSPSQLPTKVADGNADVTNLSYDARGNLVGISTAVTSTTVALTQLDGQTDGLRFNEIANIKIDSSTGSIDAFWTGDFNGDRNPDLMIQESTSRFVRYLGDGNGRFSPLPNSPQPIVRGLRVVDFNGDSRDDFMAWTAWM